MASQGRVAKWPVQNRKVYYHEAKTYEQLGPDGKPHTIVVGPRTAKGKAHTVYFHPTPDQLLDIRADLASGMSHIDTARKWSIGNGRDSARLRRLLAKDPQPEPAADAVTAVRTKKITTYIEAAEPVPPDELDR